MTPPPLPMTYEGAGVFCTLQAYRGRADEFYGAGEIVSLAPWEDRSSASHRHLFALIHEFWQTLPERYLLQPWAQTSEALRKHALISTGHCNVEAFVCMFQTEADRLATALRKTGEDYAIIVVDGKTVTRLTAKSMSRKSMDRAAFQKAKDDTLGFIADLLDVEPAALANHARAA